MPYKETKAERESGKTILEQIEFAYQHRFFDNRSPFLSEKERKRRRILWDKVLNRSEADLKRRNELLDPPKSKKRSQNDDSEGPLEPRKYWGWEEAAGGGDANV